MHWKLPPKIKIYEALGSVADGRVELTDDGAKVYSSSRKKSYTVTYDKEKNAIMTAPFGKVISAIPRSRTSCLPVRLPMSPK